MVVQYGWRMIVQYDAGWFMVVQYDAERCMVVQGGGSGSSLQMQEWARVLLWMATCFLLL